MKAPDPDSDWESDLDPQVIRARVVEQRRQFFWIIGILGPLWIGLNLVTWLFPDGNPYLLAASVVVPEAIVLWGIGKWRRRANA